MTGCPNVMPPANNPPVANAGPNQTVTTNADVTLNGSASSDPDGDPLTFSWTQTGGTNVTLNGADTATPTFVAPSAATTLTFELTVSDGQASSSDTVDVGVNTAVQQTPILYVANITGDNVTAYDVSDPNNINGNIAPGANLAGAQTLLDQPTDIALDTQGALLVSNNGNDSVTSYPNADDLTGINGNIAPNRNVQGPATLLVTPESVAIQAVNDLLFVSDVGANAVFVFSNASTPSFNGNLPPLRTITSADMSGPIGINLDGNDNLYVANSVTDNVVVFANASSVNGPTPATRFIDSAAFTDLFDVFIDESDRMYVVDFGDDQIHVFNNASTLNSAVASPDVTLTVPGAGALTAIAVDSGGTGYVVDNTLSAVYSYDNIATRNGTIAPDRTLQGANTQLVGPIRVFLVE